MAVTTLRWMMPTTAVAFGLTLTTMSAAYAGGPPLTLPFGTDKPDTRFELTGPGDHQDLEACPQPGRDAFVGMNTEETVDAAVTDPQGRPVTTFRVDVEENNGTGAELHPKTQGCFTVRVTPDPVTPVSAFPLTTTAWFWPDCRGGPATRCTIDAGQTENGTWGGDNDGDGFRILAPAGKRYAVTLTITSGQAAAILSVVDAAGDAIVSRKTGTGPDSRLTRTLKFTLPASGGPFFAKAEATQQGHAGRGTYTLALKPL